MIVNRLESPVYYRRKRGAVATQRVERVEESQKSFDDYLLEAFQGEVVAQNSQVSDRLSNLTRENIIRLGRF